MPFGPLIACYLFLAGAGAGAFFFASLSCLVDWRFETERTAAFLRTAQKGFLCAPALIAVASFALLADLGTPDRAWMALENPFGTVLSTGAWSLVVLFCVSAGLAVLASIRALPRKVLFAGCIVGLPVACVVMTYTGVLLSSLEAVDFWNTPILVLLFVASSLTTGLAASSLAGNVAGNAGTCDSGDYSRAEFFAGVAEAVLLIVFIASRWLFTETSREGCLALLAGDGAGVFWFGVVLCGFALPAALRFMRGPLSGPAASLSTLVGGFSLRWCVIVAAAYTPLS